jgi:hypothetical protein
VTAHRCPDSCAVLPDTGHWARTGLRYPCPAPLQAVSTPVSLLSAQLPSQHGCPLCLLVPQPLGQVSGTLHAQNVMWTEQTQGSGLSRLLSLAPSQGPTETQRIQGHLSNQSHPRQGPQLDTFQKVAWFQAPLDPFTQHLEPAGIAFLTPFNLNPLFKGKWGRSLLRPLQTSFPP